MTRKKVLFIITKALWGGAQKYVFDLATHLPADQYEVVVAYGTPGQLKDKLEEVGIKTIAIDALGRDINPLLDIASFFKIFKIIGEEHPDIVHLNSPKAGGIGSLAARLRGVKNIMYTAHGWAFNEERGTLSRFFLKFLSWLTTLLSHKVIVLGEKEKRQITHLPFTKRKVVKIYNGLKLPEFKTYDDARQFIAFKTNLPQDKKHIPWIGTISELHKNKGLTYAIEAISRIQSPILFFIIGEGEEHSALESLIKKHGVEDKVFLLGQIDNAASYLPAFDIFTLTSVKEGLPYAILEAGSAGVPVIATHVGNIPEMIIDNASGKLIPSKNPRAIQDALTSLLLDRETQRRYTTELKKKIDREFSFDHMIQKTFELYRN